jgi:two-component system sensor histidine kinase DesK
MSMASSAPQPTPQTHRPSSEPVRPSFFGSAFLGDRTRAPQRVLIGRLMGGVWIVFLIYPLIDLFRGDTSWPARVLLLLGLVAFTGLWLALAILRNGGELNKPFSPLRWAGIAVLYLLAVALSIASGLAWQGLFYYFVSTVGWLRPRVAVRIVGLAAVTVLVLGIAFHQSTLNLSANVLQTILVGFLIVSMFQLVRANAELRAAREELARLAVAEERLRFARDLHDLLGHSLSLITLKSELAGRLATTAPERAASEIRDIEQVARKALREVREAVAGYRQPTLDAELAGARTLLTAGGIACTIDGAPDDLPGNVDALFAWAVREGVTNVIRHSQANRCTISFASDGDAVSLTLTDDGRGTAHSDDAVPRRIGGSGLAGLAERVAAAGGRMEVGPLPGGGYRLHVTAPLHAQEAPESAPDDATEATA